jgi:hypothetical protein
MQPDIPQLLSQARQATRRSKELVTESMEAIEQLAKIRARAKRQAAETKAVLRASAQPALSTVSRRFFFDFRETPD